jgi:hypothetical protein
MRLVPWLLPACLGPQAAVFVFNTASVLLGHTDPLLGSPLSNWVIGMVVGAVLAALSSAALIAVDLLLHRRGGRALPTGWRGWAGAGAALPGAMAVWEVARPGDFDGGGLVAFALVVPVLASALAVRLIFSARPSRS